MARANASTNSTLLRLLSDNIVEMVQFFDGRGRCAYATASARAFFGVSPDGVMPSIAEQAMRGAVDRAGSESLRNVHASVMSSGEPVEFECQVHDAQGSVRLLQVQAKRVKSMPPAGFPGLMLVLRDITEQKRADDFEQQLGDRHSGKRVLVAEDDPVSQGMMQATLSAWGLDVEIASNGEDACRRAAARAFDLVLMDVQMPVLNGLQATRRIRELPGYASVPIIALTANAFEQDRKNCTAAGMSDFVSKPVDLKILFACMLAALDNCAELRQTDAAPSVVEGVPDTPEPYPGIALQQALSNWGAPGSYAKYLGVFLATYREVVAQIQSADPTNGCALAHKLKGGAGQLGLVEVSACAARAEAVLRAGDDPENELGHLAAAMRVTCASIESFLAEYLQDPAGHSASR